MKNYLLLASVAVLVISTVAQQAPWVQKTREPTPAAQPTKQSTASPPTSDLMESLNRKYANIDDKDVQKAIIKFAYETLKKTGEEVDSNGAVLSDSSKCYQQFFISGTRIFEYVSDGFFSDSKQAVSTFDGVFDAFERCFIANPSDVRPGTVASLRNELKDLVRVQSDVIFRQNRMMWDEPRQQGDQIEERQMQGERIQGRQIQGGQILENQIQERQLRGNQKKGRQVRGKQTQKKQQNGRQTQVKQTQKKQQNGKQTKNQKRKAKKQQQKQKKKQQPKQKAKQQQLKRKQNQQNRLNP